MFGVGFARGVVLNLTAMLKVYFTFIVALLTWPVEADNYRMIAPEKLPREAQELLMRHFAATEVSYAAAERSLFEREYKVFLADGTTIEFDRSGKWSDIDCPKGEVPRVLVPKMIREVIDRQYPARSIEQIERTKKGYEVELRGGTELKFDRQLRLIKIDD